MKAVWLLAFDYNPFTIWKLKLYHHWLTTKTHPVVNASFVKINLATISLHSSNSPFHVSDQMVRAEGLHQGWWTWLYEFADNFLSGLHWGHVGDELVVECLVRWPLRPLRGWGGADTPQTWALWCLWSNTKYALGQHTFDVSWSFYPDHKDMQWHRSDFEHTSVFLSFQIMINVK